MYKREEAKEQIYVLRSADKTITKIGRSYNPDHRTDSICISERKRYYLVYQSIPLLREEAKTYEEWRGENLILGHYANWSLI